MSKRRPAVILVALVLIGVFLLGYFSDNSAQGIVTVAFSGFAKVKHSSEAPDGRLAIFQLTNGTPHKVAFYVESLESRTIDGWLTNTIRRTPIEWPHNNNWAPLVPYESRELRVPPPTSGVWRLRFAGQEKTKGLTGIRDRVTDFFRYYSWRLGAMTGERFEGTRLEFITPEVVE